MKVILKRRYFKDYTSFSCTYEGRELKIETPFSEFEIDDDITQRVVRFLKNKIAQIIAGEIMFEIVTEETKKEIEAKRSDKVKPKKRNIKADKKSEVGNGKALVRKVGK